jgi:hypothetical protein
MVYTISENALGNKFVLLHTAKRIALVDPDQTATGLTSQGDQNLHGASKVLVAAYLIPVVTAPSITSFHVDNSMHTYNAMQSINVMRKPYA